MTNPDFYALAKSMHCHAVFCDKKEDLPAKMAEFMEYDNRRPVLFHVKVTDRFVFFFFLFFLNIEIGLSSSSCL